MTIWLLWLTELQLSSGYWNLTEILTEIFDWKSSPVSQQTMTEISVQWQSSIGYTVRLSQVNSSKIVKLKIFLFSSMSLSFANPQTWIYVTNRCSEYMYQLAHTTSKLIGYHGQYEGEHTKSKKWEKWSKELGNIMTALSCNCICTTHIQISLGCDQYLDMKIEIEIWNFSILCNNVCISLYVCC